MLVSAHRDDASGSKLLGRKHTHQPDRAVADYDCGAARRDACGIGSIPASAQDIGGSEQAGDQVFGRHRVNGDQRTIGQGDAGIGSLSAGHEFAVFAGTLEAKAAVRAGVIRQAERADNKLADLDVPDFTADLCYDTAIFVSHMLGAVNGLKAAIRPKVRTADTRGRKPDDRVSGFLNLGLRNFLATDVAGNAKDCTEHTNLQFGPNARLILLGR